MNRKVKLGRILYKKSIATFGSKYTFCTSLKHIFKAYVMITD